MAPLIVLLNHLVFPVLRMAFKMQLSMPQLGTKQLALLAVFFLIVNQKF
jgi:hypothetical protein